MNAWNLMVSGETESIKHKLNKQSGIQLENLATEIQRASKLVDFFRKNAILWAKVLEENKKHSFFRCNKQSPGYYKECEINASLANQSLTRVLDIKSDLIENLKTVFVQP